jgi:hypothetical protein
LPRDVDDARWELHDLREAEAAAREVLAKEIADELRSDALIARW